MILIYCIIRLGFPPLFFLSFLNHKKNKILIPLFFSFFLLGDDNDDDDKAYDKAQAQAHDKAKADDKWSKGPTTRPKDRSI
jgi:hypothetical protein